jgi:hypothetical protein
MVPVRRLLCFVAIPGAGLDDVAAMDDRGRLYQWCRGRGFPQRPWTGTERLEQDQVSRVELSLPRAEQPHRAPEHLQARTSADDGVDVRALPSTTAVGRRRDRAARPPRSTRRDSRISWVQGCRHVSAGRGSTRGGRGSGRRWVSWFKQHRGILEADVIPAAGPTPDVDWLLHVRRPASRTPRRYNPRPVAVAAPSGRLRYSGQAGHRAALTAQRRRSTSMAGAAWSRAIPASSMSWLTQSRIRERMVDPISSILGHRCHR